MVITDSYVLCFQRVSARLNMNISVSEKRQQIVFPACLCTAKYEYVQFSRWRPLQEFPACLCTAKYEYIDVTLGDTILGFQRVSARLNMNMCSWRSRMANRFQRVSARLNMNIYIAQQEYDSCFQRVSARLNMNIAMGPTCRPWRPFPACLCAAKYEYNEFVNASDEEFPACLCTAKYEYMFEWDWRRFQRFPACLCTAKYEYMKERSDERV